MCICIYVYLCTCACGGQRSTTSAVLQETPPLITEVSHWPGTCHFSLAGWPASSRHPLVSASRVLELQEHGTTPGCFWGSNLGPHTGTVSALLTKAISKVHDPFFLLGGHKSLFVCVGAGAHFMPTAGSNYKMGRKI